MKKITYIKPIAFLITLFCVVSFGYGQIFSNDITDTNPSLNNPYTNLQVVDGNITVSGIGRGTGILARTGLNRYNATGWDEIALEANTYFEFKITPNVNFEIDFSSFAYTGETSPQGPTNLAIRSSLDGYSSDIGASTLTGTTIDLSSSIYQNITTEITFRMYAWGATALLGTFSVNDFIFNGTVATAPCLTTVTWDGTNWSAPPDLTTIAEINADYDTRNGGNEVSFSACRLMVNNGFTLTIDDGDYLVVQNDIIVNSGGFILVRPQGAVLQIDDTETVTADGTITVEKFTAPMNAWYEYTYWSSPVSGETIGNALSFSDASRRFVFNAQNFLDATAETGNNNATVAGQDDIDDNGNDWQFVNNGTGMTPGVGYASTHDEAGFISFGPLPWSFKYIFEGPFNNGVITVPLYRNDTAPTDDNNWNLIGNPYPSAIDADLFLAANANVDGSVTTDYTIDGAIFLWSQSTPPSSTANGNEVNNFSDADYAIINGTGETAGGDLLVPNRFIPSGQAFFISMSNTAPATLVSGDVYTADVIFNNSMRVFGATDNSQFFKNSNSKKSSASVANKLWIDLTSDNGVFNQTLIGYVNGASNNDDGAYFDARKNLSAVSSAILYSTIDGSDKKFAIQGKAPSDLNESEVISLGFKTSIGVATLYTLSIPQLQGDFLNGNTVYLKDNLLNKTHDLSASDYTFTSEVGKFNSRFQIGFNAQALSADAFELDENKLSIIELENDHIQFAVSNSSSIKSVKIFDVLGQQLYNLKGQRSTETYNLSNLNSSIFIAKVELSNGALITKKAVKR